jgi:hypothetical protein
MQILPVKTSAKQQDKLKLEQKRESNPSVFRPKMILFLIKVIFKGKKMYILISFL